VAFGLFVSENEALTEWWEILWASIGHGLIDLRYHPSAVMYSKSNWARLLCGDEIIAKVRVTVEGLCLVY